MKIDGFEIQRSEDGELITLVFTSDSGKRQEATLSKSQMPAFAGRLQKEAHGESVVPIRTLTEEEVFDLKSFSTRINHRTGEIILDLHVRLPGQDNRGVTIPLHFTKEDVDALKTMLP